MLKIFYISILLFSSLYGECKGWIRQKNIPNKAYCWDIEYIKSTDGGIEYIIDKRKTIKKHKGNELLIMVNVYGYSQKKPTVLLNYKRAKLIKKFDGKKLRINNLNVYVDAQNPTIAKNKKKKEVRYYLKIDRDEDIEEDI